MKKKRKTTHVIQNGARDSGITAVGAVPWGTHFCQFYQSQKDLLDTLIPYFSAGLKQNEYCVLITSEFLTKNEVLKALKINIPQFSGYFKKGQIEIIPYTDWYLKEGKFELKRVLKQWVAKHNQGLALGYEGLRVSGNPFWINNKKDWNDFAAYEAEINNVIADYKLLVLCTYSLEKCSADEVLDVVTNHEFAVIKRSKGWELIETAKQKKTKEALMESHERLRSFMSIVSHELKTPLTPILMALNLIEKRGVSHPATTNALKIIKHQTENMTKILKDLSDISRIERGKIELDKEKLYISDIMRNAADIIKPVIKERKQTLQVTYPKTNVSITADPFRLEQILNNLLANASKFSEENKVIKLTSGLNKNSVFITVKDHGMGIAKEMLPKIFNLFFQGDYLPNRKKGLGVGLYLSRELARLQGGDLYAESAGSGKGSEFTLRMPVNKR